MRRLPLWSTFLLCAGLLAVFQFARPDRVTQISRLLAAHWLEVDDLWSIRLELESNGRADEHARALLSQVYVRLGERPLAAAVLAKPTLASAPSAASAPAFTDVPEPRHRTAVRAAISRGDLVEVRRLLDRAKPWDGIWSTRMLARLDVVERKPALAREQLAGLLRQHRRYRYLAREAARAFESESRWRDAEGALRTEIAQAPALETRPYWELATVFLHARNLRAAYETYQDLYRAVPSEPDAPFYVCEMARVVTAEGTAQASVNAQAGTTRDDPLRVCAHARRERPGDHRIALEIARVLAQRGRYADGQALLVAERDATPNREGPWRALIEWEFETRRYDAARVVANHARERFPHAAWPRDAISRADHLQHETF